MSGSPDQAGVSRDQRENRMGAGFTLLREPSNVIAVGDLVIGSGHQPACNVAASFVRGWLQLSKRYSND